MNVEGAKTKPFKTPLYGFGGERIYAEGAIQLPVTFGVHPAKVTQMVDFLLVDQPSTYNAIIGRPTLNALRAVVSTYHLAMKFPAGEQVGEVRGNQAESRECYSMSTRVAEKQKVVNTVFHLEEKIVPLAPDNISHTLGELDPREKGQEKRGGPIEELESIQLDDPHPERVIQIELQLPGYLREKLISFLREYKDVFAWSNEDMSGIDHSVIAHKLNVDPVHKPVVQKRQKFNPKRYMAINEEVGKLLAARFIREVHYPEWLANVVMVKKANRKWRICIYYTDLNKACPKDSFLIPRIDQLVDATTGHKLVSFMDAYSGYNQIRMSPEDEDKTSFMIDRSLHCYKIMPFGLKNVGATYQCLVNKGFSDLIGRTKEVYVNDMLVKSLKKDDHVSDLCEIFVLLRKYNMKLNQNKCAFGVGSGKFLGFMVNHRGIEANPSKVQALLDLQSPKMVKDIQKLTGMIAALSPFVSKSTDKCRPFFQALKWGEISLGWPNVKKHSNRSSST